jgi:hypothetical protein
MKEIIQNVTFSMSSAELLCTINSLLVRCDALMRPKGQHCQQHSHMLGTQGTRKCWVWNYHTWTPTHGKLE